MFINIHDSLTFEKITIFNDYISLIWCKRFFDVGAIDIEVDCTIENLHIFQKNRFITRDDDDSVYKINAINIQTNDDGVNSLIIGAVDCKEILNQRIILNYISVADDTLLSYLQKILNENVINPTSVARKLTWFNLDVSDIPTTLISDKCRFEFVGEKIIEICKKYNLGWKVTKNWEIKFFQGKDLTSIVNFKPEYDNILNTKYANSLDNYKNVVYVSGDGEDFEKLTEEAYLGKIPGDLFRFEMETNATDENGNIFVSKGKETLKEKTIKETFEAEILQTLFTYKTDYNLGDIVNIENEFGISVKARITEIIETWNNEGYTLEPKFEFFEVSNEQSLLNEIGVELELEENVNALSVENVFIVNDSLAIVQKKMMALTSENEVMLLDENDDLIVYEV